MGKRENCLIIFSFQKIFKSKWQLPLTTLSAVPAQCGSQIKICSGVCCLSMSFIPVQVSAVMKCHTQKTSEYLTGLGPPVSHMCMYIILHFRNLWSLLQRFRLFCAFLKICFKLLFDAKHKGFYFFAFRSNARCISVGDLESKLFSLHPLHTQTIQIPVSHLIPFTSNMRTRELGVRLHLLVISKLRAINSDQHDQANMS